MTATTTTPPTTTFEQRRGYDYEVEVDEEQRQLDAEAARLRRAADLRFGGDAEAKLLNQCQLVAEACGTNPETGEPYYSSTDVLGWLARAVDIGCEAPVLGRATVERLFRVELIPNALLRERYEELKEKGETSSSKLAAQLGLWKTKNGRKVGDASAVERQLGVIGKPETSPNGREYVALRLFVTYDQAVALANALDIPFHDLGV